ncbi:MAG: hypothetical protein ABSC23_11230 [Bryobacteraceae bacterium]|jgi:hypothetical protein
MTKKLLFVGTILLLVVCVALAADAITGKWTMSQEGRNGGPARVTTFDLKVDGANLTGTVLAPMGGRGGGGGGAVPAPTPTPITHGKVAGSTITFDVTRTTPNGDMTMKYEGTVSGDTIHFKITSDFGNGPQTREADAKRSTT